MRGSKELTAWTSVYFYFKEHFVSNDYLGLCSVIADMKFLNLIDEDERDYLKLEISQDILKLDIPGRRYLFAMRDYPLRLKYIRDKIAEYK